VTVNEKMVGSINVRIDRTASHGEVSFSMARRHWDSGMCTEALVAVIEAGRHEPWLELLYGTTDRRNLASQRVMEKAGMERDRDFRSSRTRGGQPVEEARYTISLKE
jgi:RimJ/RimL family protein N-acetyltransferase